MIFSIFTKISQKTFEMSNTIRIYTLEKKNKIVFLLTNNVCLMGLNRNQKASSRHHCDSFELEQGELRFKNCNKLLVCKFETERIQNIIRTEHELDHISARPTYSRICASYVGITFTQVESFIRNCNRCRLETARRIEPSVVSITTSYVRERFISDSINMTRYSDENDVIVTSIQ